MNQQEKIDNCKQFLHNNKQTFCPDCYIEEEPNMIEELPTPEEKEIANDICNHFFDLGARIGWLDFKYVIKEIRQLRNNFQDFTQDYPDRTSPLNKPSAFKRQIEI